MWTDKFAIFLASPCKSVHPNVIFSDCWCWICWHFVLQTMLS